MFSVSSSYKALGEIALLEEGLNDLEQWVFTNLWKSPSPSKVVAFSWMAILDRIPTRSNLAFWHVIGQGEDTLCVLCDHEIESTSYLFCIVSLYL